MAHCGHACRYQSSIALSHENQELLASFRKSYWEFYGALRAYQKAPSAAGAARVEARFDALFGMRTGWDLLRQLKQRDAQGEDVTGLHVSGELPSSLL
jgi:hypothetical protein